MVMESSHSSRALTETVICNVLSALVGVFVSIISQRSLWVVAASIRTTVLCCVGEHTVCTLHHPVTAHACMFVQMHFHFSGYLLGVGLLGYLITCWLILRVCGEILHYSLLCLSSQTVYFIDVNIFFLIGFIKTFIEA